MKVNTPEISWHGRDPVYSCDVQPHQGGKSPLRIATAGTDSNVRVSLSCSLGCDHIEVYNLLSATDNVQVM